MLTPEYLEDLPGSIVDLYRQAEDAILADMARRISNMDLFSPAADWQYRKLREAGALSDDILEELSRLTHKTKTELKKLMQEAANVSLGYDESVYEGVGITGEPLSSSEPLRRILNAGYAKTAQTMRNLTGTTARTASQQFERALDQAWMKVNTGGFSTDQAVRDAVKEISARGVESITYRKDGEVTRTDTLEVATRRAVVTGVNQTCGELQLERAKEMGADLMELTAHEGARPSHAEWQGQIVSLSGQLGYLSLDDIGYGDVTGFKGANCRHDWNPWFEGMPRTWTPEALAKLNEKRYEYNGKKLTQYEASQIQRANEREIRRWKREYKAMEAAGQDTSEAAAKISYWNKRQDDFLQQTGFKRQQSREEIAGFTWKDQKTASEQAAEAMKKAQSMDNAADVYPVGKIDIEKYRCVTPDIATEEVVITEERIVHIKEHHPNDFERYSGYMQDMVENPKYIIADSDPNTAVLLKQYEEDGEQFRLILRLAVTKDEKYKKNSIITFLRISEKTYKKYIRKYTREGKILYKSG